MINWNSSQEEVKKVFHAQHLAGETVALWLTDENIPTFYEALFCQRCGSLISTTPCFPVKGKALIVTRSNALLEKWSHPLCTPPPEEKTRRVETTTNNNVKPGKKSSKRKRTPRIDRLLLGWKEL